MSGQRGLRGCEHAPVSDIDESGPPSGRCPVCTAAAVQTRRYPRALCEPCAGRATDLKGRRVDLANVSMSGGLVAHHGDDGSLCSQVSRDGRVLIDGNEFRAGEHRFGGTVIQPLR